MRPRTHLARSLISLGLVAQAGGALAGCVTTERRTPESTAASQYDCAVPAALAADAVRALELASAIARRVWPEWTPGAVPFAIVDTHHEWLFRASSLPAEVATAAPTRDDRARVCSSPLGPAYRTPSPLRSLAPDAPSPFFARADRRGEALTFTIAAPALAPFPVADWAAVFVHEYFHTYQLSDERWGRDAPHFASAARRRLAVLYETEAQVRSSVADELNVYRALLQNQGPPRCAAISAAPSAEATSRPVSTRRESRRESKSEHLSNHDTGDTPATQALRLRATRRALLAALDPSLPAAEAALERFEGVARFVEEAASDKSPPPPGGPTESRTRDRSSPQRATPSLPPPTLDAGDGDMRPHRGLAVSAGEYPYATGYALARLLDACIHDWRSRLAGRDLLELLVAGEGP